MDNKLEDLWNSYVFKKYPLELKYQEEIEKKERFIDQILSSCNKEVACRFVPWLYDYVLLKQKIAFEAAYTFSKNEDN